MMFHFVSCRDYILIFTVFIMEDREESDVESRGEYDGGVIRIAHEEMEDTAALKRRRSLMLSKMPFEDEVPSVRYRRSVLEDGRRVETTVIGVGSDTSVIEDAHGSYEVPEARDKYVEETAARLAEIKENINGDVDVPINEMYRGIVDGE